MTTHVSWNISFRKVKSSFFLWLSKGLIIWKTSMIQKVWTSNVLLKFDNEFSRWLIAAISRGAKNCESKTTRHRSTKIQPMHYVLEGFKGIRPTPKSPCLFSPLNIWQECLVDKWAVLPPLLFNLSLDLQSIGTCTCRYTMPWLPYVLLYCTTAELVCVYVWVRV